MVTRQAIGAPAATRPRRHAPADGRVHLRTSTAAKEVIARQRQTRGFNRTYVAVPVFAVAASASRTAGFYSINAASVMMKYLREARIVK